jgi:glucose-6-phosphate dehydrogenase assembly protein OpcA
VEEAVTVEASRRPAAVLARVEEELRALWSATPAPGEMPRARACTMNLVVVAPSPALAASWVPVVEEVILTIPARAVVVALDPDGADGLDASVSAVCAPSAGGGGPVCSERVTLEAGGAVCERIASCVSALCTSDVPTTLVWIGRVHVDDPVFEPLARDACRVVLDASQGSLAGLASLASWARARAEADRAGLADLAWTRLAPWQELCARMFDEPHLRALAWHVTGLTLVQASGKGTPLGSEGTLLLGWFATRLGWRAGTLAGKLRLSRSDGAPISASLRADSASKAPAGTLQVVRVEASSGGASMRAAIERDPGSDAATWRLEVTGADGETRRIEQHVRLTAWTPAALLERTLHRPTRDPALAEAATWADELGGEELACA